MGRPVTMPKKVCPNCGEAFARSCVIDGKRRGLANRRYCLSCRPFGSRETDVPLKGLRFHYSFLEGQKIGNWSVIREVERRDARFRNYLCRCECGTEKVFNVSYLNTGQPTSCHLCRAKKKEADVLAYFLGKKRGDYTIVEYLGKNEWGTRQWRCRCKCGTERIFLSGQLSDQDSGRMRCMNCCSEDLEISHRVTDQVPKRFWSRLLSTAQARDIQLDVTIEYLFSLYEEQGKACALSGVPIYFSSLGSKHNRYTTASLDRINSDRGYVVGNVQWVHKIVNFMKGSLGQDDFVSWCKLIVERGGR